MSYGILLRLWKAKTRILMGKNLVYTLLLVGVTAVWGWTFVVVQDFNM
jgi:hypothetical protein